jgi:hypothetical protein
VIIAINDTLVNSTGAPAVKRAEGADSPGAHARSPAAARHRDNIDLALHGNYEQQNGIFPWSYFKLFFKMKENMESKDLAQSEFNWVLPIATYRRAKCASISPVVALGW